VLHISGNYIKRNRKLTREAVNLFWRL